MNAWDFERWVAVLSVLIAALALIGSALGVHMRRDEDKRKDAAEKMKEIDDKTERERDEYRQRVRDLEKQLSQVQQTIVPINAAFQAILVKELTHFHTPEMDALLQKLGPPVTLTPDEEGRLAQLLAERALDLNGDIDEHERDAAAILPAVVRRVKAEATIPVAAMDVQSVAVPASAEEPSEK